VAGKTRASWSPSRRSRLMAKRLSWWSGAAGYCWGAVDRARLGDVVDVGCGSGGPLNGILLSSQIGRCLLPVLPRTTGDGPVAWPLFLALRPPAAAPALSAATPAAAARSVPTTRRPRPTACRSRPTNGRMITPNMPTSRDSQDRVTGSLADPTQGASVGGYSEPERQARSRGSGGHRLPTVKAGSSGHAGDETATELHRAHKRSKCPVHRHQFRRSCFRPLDPQLP
jgi:hypothetical protein